MSGRGRNRRALLQLASLAALLPGALLGGLAVARGTCDVVLEPYPGLAIPADTQVAGRRFGGISGVDFDRRGKRLIYVSDERAPADAAVAYGSARFSSAAAASALGPVSIEPLSGISSSDGIDFEALRIDPRRNVWWIASEGREMPVAPAWIGRFDRRRGLQMRILLPAPFDAVQPNRAIESLAFDGRGRLWIALENALTVDGPQGNRYRGADLRILRLTIDDATPSMRDVVAGVQESLLYLTEPAESGDEGDSDIGISELLRVDDGWWVLERAGLLGKDGRYRFRSRLFCAEKDASSTRLRKTLLLDSAQWVDPLEANFEAMTIIPQRGRRPLLVIVNDNNYAPGVATRVLLWEISRP